MAEGKKQMGYRIFFLVLFLLPLFSGTRAAAADYAGVKQAVIEAYEDGKTTVDVTEYKVYNTTAGSKKIASAMAQVFNETPGIFYNGRTFSKEIIAETQQVVKIHLSYASKYKSGKAVNKKKIASVRKRLNAAAKKAAETITDDMTDIEKALLLHDYLVRKVSYSDNSKAVDRLSEVGALLQHKANCQGYSVAYLFLLEQAGIRAKCVESDKMSHMWNLVQIHSNWYHVDVTWDDSLNAANQKDQFGIVLHKNFLLSNAAVKKQGHYGFSASKATDRSYDSAFWRGVETAFWYQSGSFVYGTSSGIYSRTGIAKKAARIKAMGADCLVRYSNNRYFFISGQSIYQINLSTKKVSKKYTAPSGCYLCQLKCSKTKLFFRYYKQGQLYTVKKKI
ncbi:MAG: hypothetical protein LUH14_00850 [Clostridiaceae bacterium]|nr:hypothetical protein [Clostridiaceae bacterium]